GMKLTEYELDKEQKRAVLFYKYDNQIVQYSMYMNDLDSSYGRIEPDKLTDEYKMQLKNNINVDVKEYSIDGYEVNRYEASFEYMDAQYQLIGSMEKE